MSKKVRRLLKKASNLVLYHGTNSIAVKSILESGSLYSLNSGAETNQYAHTFTVNQDAIYLTSDKELAYSFAGAGTHSDYGKKYLPVIIELNLDSDDPNFIADEWSLGDYSEEELMKMFGEFIDDEDDLEYAVREALNQEGFESTDHDIVVKVLENMDPIKELNSGKTIAYSGTIPTSSISKLIVYDLAKNAIDCEPTVEALEKVLSQNLQKA